MGLPPATAANELRGRTLSLPPPRRAGHPGGADLRLPDTSRQMGKGWWNGQAHPPRRLSELHVTKSLHAAAVGGGVWFGLWLLAPGCLQLVGIVGPHAG